MKTHFNSILKECGRLIRGECFAPIDVTASLSSALKGRSFTTLYISHAKLILAKIVYKDDEFHVIGLKAFENEKSIDFASFVDSIVKRESFKADVSFGIGCLVSVMPYEFYADTLSPSRLSIPMSIGPANKTTKLLSNEASAAVQQHWLDYWLDKDPAFAFERCAAGITYNKELAYRTMYLPVIGEFVVGAIPQDVLQSIAYLETVVPIIDIRYMPFQLLGVAANKLDLFSARGGNSDAEDSNEPAPKEYSGLWGVYIMDHLINFAWRRHDDDTTEKHEGFFASYIRYVAPQVNATAMQQAISSAFRDSAAYFVKGVLMPSSTINEDPEKFLLFCTDTDPNRKVPLLPILQKTLLKPVAELRWDEKKLVNLVVNDVSPEIRSLLTLQLAV